MWGLLVRIVLGSKRTRQVLYQVSHTPVLCVNLTDRNANSVLSNRIPFLSFVEKYSLGLYLEFNSFAPYKFVLLLLFLLVIVTSVWFLIV
jgi:hypothetical protein